MKCPECGKKMKFIERILELLGTVWECKDCEIHILRPEEGGE